MTETPRLDATDKKILHLLDFHARMSYTDLGKKIGKTKQYVRHRVERLKEKGVITGTHTVIDVTKMGYIYARMLVRLSKTDENIEKEMFTYLQKQKQTGWLVSTGGAYDFAAVIMTKNITDYEKTLDAFSSQFKNNLATVHTSIATRIWHFPHKMFSSTPPHEELVFGAKSANIEIDYTDKALLREIYNNGNESSVKLSQKTLLTPAATIARMRRLENERIILAYRLNIDTELLGYQMYKVFLVMHNLSEDFLKEFIKYCRDETHILYVTKALGEATLELQLLATSNQEFNKILKKVRSDFAQHIRSVEFLEEYKTHLVNYAPF